MSGFAVELVITGMGRDPDGRTEADQTNGLGKKWRCINMNQSLPCFDIINKEIPMDPFDDKLALTFPRKTLPPYNAHNIILTISKGDRN